MRTTHLTRCAGAFVALTLMTASAPSHAQDTVARTRHLLALDVARMRPFTRSYDMVVHGGDSVVVIGQRDVVLGQATYAGQPAWLLTESRTGVVAALDSLFLAFDLRPLHWSSALGRSRLGAEFSADSMFGAVATPAARRSMILGIPPDLLVSTAMVEALVAVLPVAADWSDSAAVLAVDAGDLQVLPAELAIVGEEPPLQGDTTGGSWLLVVRTERAQLQLWIDKTLGEVTRIEQTLPPHVGTRLVFRLRAVPTTTPSPP